MSQNPNQPASRGQSANQNRGFTGWIIVVAMAVIIVVISLVLWLVISSSLKEIEAIRPQLIVGLLVILGISVLAMLFFIVTAGLHAFNVFDALSQNRSVGWPIVGTLVIIVGVITGLVLAIFYPNGQPALIVGLLVVLGVSVLTVLLFIMAAGFTALKMNNPKEALGLPKGSVRAMIALLLIIVWVILSVYLFAFLGNSTTMPGPNGTTITVGPNQDNVRFAQQLYSTLATLVVAVVAFYFGSKNVALAAEVTGASTSPVIVAIVPETGKQNDTISPFTIIGHNFRQKPSNVRLFLDQNNTIEGTNIALQSTEKITCDIAIRADQKAGQYDVVVVNTDGSTYQLPKAFTVTSAGPPPAGPPPAGPPPGP